MSGSWLDIEFTVPDQKPLSSLLEVELQRGDTLVIHYENSPANELVNDQGNNRAKHIARVSGQLIDMFRDDPELGGCAG